MSRPYMTNGAPEEQLAAAQQLQPGNLDLLTIFQPLIGGDLDSDFLGSLSRRSSRRHQNRCGHEETVLRVNPSCVFSFS